MNGIDKFWSFEVEGSKWPNRKDHTLSYPSFTEDTMFSDSDSSCHIRNTLEGMFDIETINEQISGVGNNIRATSKSKLKAEVVQADGSKTTTILSQVKYSKGLDIVPIPGEHVKEERALVAARRQLQRAT